MMSGYSVQNILRRNYMNFDRDIFYYWIGRDKFKTSWVRQLLQRPLRGITIAMQSNPSQIDRMYETSGAFVTSDPKYVERYGGGFYPAMATTFNQVIYIYNDLDVDQENILKVFASLNDFKMIEYTLYVKRINSLSYSSRIYISRLVDGKNSEFETPHTLMGEFQFGVEESKAALYCTLSSKFIPHNLLYEGTRVDPSKQAGYQTEVVIMSSVFCTNILTFPFDADASSPVNSTIYNQIDGNQFWYSSPLMPKPSKVNGLLDNGAKFVQSSYFQQKFQNSLGRLRSLSKINSATFVFNLLPEEQQNQARIPFFVLQYSLDGLSTQIYNNYPYHLHNDRECFEKPLSHTGYCTGQRFYEGRTYLSTFFHKIEYIKEEVLDPDCQIYDAVNRCSVCNQFTSYTDYFRRGRCRSLSEDCPHGTGFFKPPISWEQPNIKFCLTCPHNSYECFRDNRWVNSPIPQKSEIVGVNGDGSMRSATCIEPNCDICELTTCDKCRSGWTRIWVNSKTFVCQESSICLANQLTYFNSTFDYRLNPRNILFCLNMTDTSNLLNDFHDTLIGFAIRDAPPWLTTAAFLRDACIKCFSQSLTELSQVCSARDRENCLRGSEADTIDRVFCRNGLRMRENQLNDYSYFNLQINMMNLCEPKPVQDEGYNSCLLFNSTNSCQECPSEMVMFQDKDFRYYCRLSSTKISVPGDFKPSSDRNK